MSSQSNRHRSTKDALETVGLANFATHFIEEGFSTEEDLFELSEDEAREHAREAGMKRGHSIRFVRLIREGNNPPSSSEFPADADLSQKWDPSSAEVSASKAGDMMFTAGAAVVAKAEVEVVEEKKLAEAEDEMLAAEAATTAKVEEQRSTADAGVKGKVKEERLAAEAASAAEAGDDRLADEAAAETGEDEGEGASSPDRVKLDGEFEAEAAAEVLDGCSREGPSPHKPERLIDQGLSVPGQEGPPVQGSERPLVHFNEPEAPPVQGASFQGGEGLSVPGPEGRFVQLQEPGGSSVHLYEPEGPPIQGPLFQGQENPSVLGPEGPLVHEPQGPSAFSLSDVAAAIAQLSPTALDKREEQPFDAAPSNVASVHYELLLRAYGRAEWLAEEAEVVAALGDALEADSYHQLKDACAGCARLQAKKEKLHALLDVNLTPADELLVGQCESRLEEIEGKRSMWRQKVEAQLDMLISGRGDLETLQAAVHLATDGTVINGTRISLSSECGITEHTTASGDTRRKTLLGAGAGQVEVHLEDLDKVGVDMTPEQLSETFSKHALLTIACEALEAIAATTHDDLDKDRIRERREETELLAELGVEPEAKEQGGWVRGRPWDPMLEEGGGDDKNGELVLLGHHLEEEIDDLAMLDEAFAHLAERFKNRLSVRFLDDANRHEHHALLPPQGEAGEDGTDDSASRDGPSKSVEASGIARKPIWRVNNLVSMIGQSGMSKIERIVFYKVPKVRGYHGAHDDAHGHEDHEANWADLFFDLTYVAAAYRLGNFLKADASYLGFFYFLVNALNLMDAWKFKTLHDSTFESKDVAHKFLDVLYAITIACAAVSVSTREEYEDQRTGHANAFCLSLLLNSVIIFVEHVEVLVVSTSKVAPRHCRQLLLFEVLPRLFFYLFAYILSRMGKVHAQQYYAHHDDFQSAKPSEFESAFTVTLLLFAAHFASSVLPTLGYMTKLMPPSPIPWHYHHILHRYGEWVMLMLGESILSMILAPVVPRQRYYVAFLAGLVMVQIMQMIHFECEEFDPTQHALSRKLRAGRVWLQLMAIYSIGLIAFGVGLKAHLYYIVCDETGGSSYGYGGSSYGYGGSSYSSSYSSYSSPPSYASYAEGGRRLASSYGDAGYISNEYCSSVPIRYTRLLCGACLVQYVALQTTITLHEGMTDYLVHFFDFDKTKATIVLGIKALTCLVVLIIAVLPSFVPMPAHEIILVLLSVTVVQGLAQLYENQLMQARRVEQGTLKRMPTANLVDFYRGGIGTEKRWSWRDVLPTSAVKKMEVEKAARKNKWNEATNGEIARIRRIFKMTDLDHSGFLDCGELVRVLKLLGMPSDVASVQGMISKVDPGEDGVMDFSEFAAALGYPGAPNDDDEWTDVENPEIGRIRKVFKMMDVDNSGELDSDELRRTLKLLGMPSDETTVNQMMSEADEDGNGVMDFSEFASALGYPGLSNLNGDDDMQSMYTAVA